MTKVHNQGKRYVAQGRVLILIGHAGHPEVEGTLGQIDGPVMLVQNEKEVEALDIPADTPVAYVTQTTLSVDDTRGIIAALNAAIATSSDPRRATSATPRKTASRRCASSASSSTSYWWSAPRIVPIRIGCARSARRLAFRATSSPTAASLHPQWVKDAHVIGITAGASAPEVLVDDVIDTLRRLGDGRSLDSAGPAGEYRVPVAARTSDELRRLLARQNAN